MKRPSPIQICEENGPTMNELPAAFIESLTKHFGQEVATSIQDALILEPSISIRLHPDKPATLEWESNSIPWCDEGHLLHQRPNFAQDPHFHAGGYYVQESSSMFLKKVWKALGFENKAMVALDMCAAPGGKSTLLLDTLSKESTVVCNEIDGKRNAVLRENLLKWGSSNSIVTKSSADKLASVGSIFDLILLDAPCSGEGMFRKDKFAIKQWNPGLVDHCSVIQADLIEQASRLLRNEGYLVYSTCTLNPNENEQNVLRALESGFELSLPESGSLAHESFLHPAMLNGKLLGYYLLPGKSTGEGLFFSILRKGAENQASAEFKASKLKTIDADQLNPECSFQSSNYQSYLEHQDKIMGFNGSLDVLNTLSAHAFITQVGLPVLERKGKGMIPHHGLAMDASSEVDIALSKEEALDYLRKSKSPPATEAKGWKTVGYKGITLGWAKVLDQRTNNYYPSSLRLRH